MRNPGGVRRAGGWAGLAVVAVVAVACSSSPTESVEERALRVDDHVGVVLLTQNVVHDVTMDALFDGGVVADEAGCLRLESPDAATVVWPHGYTAQIVLGEVVIRDGSGAVIGQVGGTFSLPGGEVVELSDAMGFSQDDRDLAESVCPGRYWIVG